MVTEEVALRTWNEIWILQADLVLRCYCSGVLVFGRSFYVSAKIFCGLRAITRCHHHEA